MIIREWQNIGTHWFRFACPQRRDCMQASRHYRHLHSKRASERSRERRSGWVLRQHFEKRQGICIRRPGGRLG
ncbi:unnamed protein product [Ectocarpus sp. CCAP 1310/34]|nr:unnamed protein product [Ectocarpus sp. CCAP 1310/34]